jgi:tyrosinase
MAHDIGMTRREALAISAAVAASGLLAQEAAGQPAAAPRVRPEARSTEGRQMLEFYRLGVQRMQATPAWNPRSWRYQANMHSVHPSDRTADAINAIFNPAQGATPAEQQAIRDARALALGENGQPQLWNGCKHGDPHFLSWHRWFLFYFERAVESHIKDALGAQRFALPYWDYTSDSIPDTRILPPEFRVPQLADGTPNALWYRFRNPCMSRITNPAPLDGADVDILRAFDQRVTLATADNPLAFSPLFEDVPHGVVHVALGNTVDGDRGMSSVPWAARDPIFWLHHANLDRLWEVWRRTPVLGRPAIDPTGDWLLEKFNFANEEGKLAPPAAAGETLKLDTFGYTYPDLPPAPVVMSQASGGPGPAAAPPLAAAARVVAATPPDTRSTLSVSSTAVRVRSLSASVGAASQEAFVGAASSRVYLQIEDIDVVEDPGTNFDVFVRRVPAGAERGAAIRVGRFSVFGLAQSDRVGTSHSHAAAARVIDITDAARGNAAFVLGSSEFEVEIRAVTGQTRAPISFKGVRVLVR